MGLDWHVADSGCCGMAGAFGFEQEPYDVSVACGERVLLPAVREAEQRGAAAGAAAVSGRRSPFTVGSALRTTGSAARDADPTALEVT